MSVVALVLAAGSGQRLEHDLPKAFVPLAGRPLLLHALAALAAVPEIERLVPVIPREERGRYAGLEDALAGIRGLAAAVVGGATRQESVRAGFAALPADASLVAVHDAARPLVRPAAVSRVIAAARRDGAALLVAPVSDTVKRVRGGRVVETPPREECFAAQTPQVFRVELLREALEKAAALGRSATDDAQLVEWLGIEVTAVPGDRDNLKITHPEDLATAARLLRERSGA